MRARPAVVVTVVVVLVLAVGLAVANRVLEQRTEERLAEAIAAQVPGSGEPAVDIGGGLFLLQLAGGRIDEVTVTTDEATVDGVVLTDVVVELGGVSTTQPATAEDLSMTADVPVATLTEVVDAPVELGVEDGSVVGTGDVLGFELAVLLDPRPDGRAVAFDLESIRVAGLEVDVGALPGGLLDQVERLTVPVDGLPPGVELTEVSVVGDGLRLVAAGSDVVLEAADA